MQKSIKNNLARHNKIVLKVSDFRYIKYFYKINEYNDDANLDASDNAILVNEPSLEMLTSQWLSR